MNLSPRPLVNWFFVFLGKKNKISHFCLCRTVTEAISPQIVLCTMTRNDLLTSPQLTYSLQMGTRFKHLYIPEPNTCGIQFFVGWLCFLCYWFLKKLTWQRCTKIHILYVPCLVGDGGHSSPKPVLNLFLIKISIYNF